MNATAETTAQGENEAARLLRRIEGWRVELARNIALRNPTISSDDLNRAVQLTIDRIVFLRMAEDRGLEPYEQLLNLCGKPDMYERFIRELCQNADDKYNSGLFHFHSERDITEEPDRITPVLTIDDKAFRPIVQSLYFAYGSPYQFSVIPVEILGTVYERFLGKVIRLTAGHHAKVEEKPEVRKAGGVYYTPSYVVDYIVQHTVGRQLEHRSPMQLAGRGDGEPFRALDVACGSGSFLLGAYQRLLDHCLKWYTENAPEKHKKAVYRNGGAGEWRLTVAEKKRILTAHVFGVDIDPQAVEVSKLSLLLKVLEGENEYTMDRQKHLFHDRALPNLSENIKCGNSLIAPDYFSGRLPPEADELRRVNPFDWERESPEAGNSGGFDCVIGNPPYGHLFDDEQAEYLSNRYPGFAAVPDAYVAFVQKAHLLLKGGGRFGFVIPSAWLGGPAYVPLREHLLQFAIETIVALPFDVFEDAYIDTLILTTKKASPEKSHRVLTYEYPKREKVSSILLDRLAASRVRQQAWHATDGNKFVLNPGMLTLIERLRHSGAVPLEQHVAIRRGVLFDPTLLTRRKTGDASYRYFEGDVYRYAVNFKAPSWVEFGPKMREYPREFHWFQGKRILLRRLVNRQQRLMAGLIDTTVITNKNLYVLKPASQESPEYVLGLLNSRLLSRIYVSQVGQATKDDFPQVTIADLLALPFRPIDFSSRSDKAKHDRTVELVEAMLTLHGQLATVQSEAEKTAVHRQIDSTDAEIDRLVYGLYGLAEEEVATVERRKP